MEKKLASGLSENLREIYVKARNKCHQVIRNSTKEYELNLAKLSKNNPKLVYRYFNRKNVFKQTIKALKSEKNGEIIIDLFDIANN